MNNAFEKNKQSIFNLFNNSELEKFIKIKRIGVWSGNDEFQSGILIAKALGELLGRFWFNIDVTGIYSNIFIESAIESAKSCKFDSNITKKWNPPYDFVINIGTKLPNNINNGISISADGWQVSANSSNILLSNNKNPIGPFGAALLSAAETIKVIFTNNNSEQSSFIPSNFYWNIWSEKDNLPPQDLNIKLDDIYVFGVGAVSHGFFWILNNWPSEITGTIHLIDSDIYSESNAQRYLGMKLHDLDKYKVDQMTKKITQSHPNLNVISHCKNMNQYFEEENPSCHIPFAIVGLDSKEMRRQLALKLPKKVVNMWTSDTHVGVSKHTYVNSGACLYCAYPDDKCSTQDEITQIFNEFKSSLTPCRIRHLYYSNEFLTSNDAEKINKVSGIDPNIIIGKPLRSIRGHLCSTTIMQIQKSSTDTQIPLVFSSGLAGMMGYVETVRETWNKNINSTRWQMAVLKFVNDYSWSKYDKNDNCYLCSDECVKKIIQKKYSKF